MHALLLMYAASIGRTWEVRTQYASFTCIVCLNVATIVIKPQATSRIDCQLPIQVESNACYEKQCERDMLGHTCHALQVAYNEKDGEGDAPPDVWRRLQAIIAYNDSSSSSSRSTTGPGAGVSDAAGIGNNYPVYVVEGALWPDTKGHSLLTA
jgi:hypothetical protein